MLTGKTNAAVAAFVERAGALIRALDRSPVADPARRLSAEELADCVVQTLALPEITIAHRFQHIST